MAEILLLAAVLAASPAAVRLDAWGTEDGLPQSSITGIAQGNNGLLYLSTFGGLSRFDGRTFDTWGLQDGAGWSTVRATALAIDTDGSLWVGLQDGGVLSLDPNGASQQLSAIPGMAAAPVTDFAVGPDGLWVATTAGVAAYNGAWTPLPNTEGARAVALEHESLWVGGDQGLQRCDPDCVDYDLGGFGVVSDLAPDGEGILVAGSTGLRRLADDRIELLEQEPVDHVSRSFDGTLWFTRGDAIVARGWGVAAQVTGGIRSIFVDREGSVWVGTDQAGLTRIFQEDWRLLRPEGGMPLFQHADRTVWMGDSCTSDGGLARLGDVGVEPPIVSGCVRAIATGRDDGEVWIGAETTLFQWRSETGLTTIADVGHTILAALWTSEGVWLGTDTGGAMLVQQNAEGANVASIDVGDERVLAVVKGLADDIWFGTHQGLSHLDSELALRRWTRADGVPVGAIRTVSIDADGTVLLGSYGGGLGIFRGGEFLRLTTEFGLTDNTVSAILDDGHGALWLNGNRGLTRVMRSDLERWIADPATMIRARRWATPEGSGGVQPAGLVQLNGTLLLPTVQGLVSMRPSNVFRNPVIPEVVIVEAEVDGVRLAERVTTQVPAGPGRVEIEFTAGTLRHPELALLEYRHTYLDTNVVEDWTPVGADRRVMWDGMEAGSHLIELRAANEEAQWSDSAELRFVLEPAWHQRGVVWAGLVGLALLFGVGLHRWRTRDVEARNAALRDEIDQRGVAVQALRISEAHYRRVFEGASDALLVVDAQRRVEHANRAADEMAGRPLSGVPIAELFGPASPEHGAALVRRDDAELWVSVAELPFDDDRVLVRAVDVTASVNAERTRHEMSQRLAQAQRLEAVGRLAGGIAHDFNNLLTSIGGTAELLSALPAPPGTDTRTPLLEGLHVCVDRGAKLTRQLLAFAGRQHLEPRRVDPAALAAGLRTLLTTSLRATTELKFVFPETPVGVRVDAAKLELALINLVLNSQEALVGHGHITIGVQRIADAEARGRWPDLPDGEKDWVVISVGDDGQGIPAELLERVFEPFFTTRPGGTGLGLSSVRGFALQSGGGLFLTSDVRKGTEASLALPYVAPLPVEAKAPRVDSASDGVGTVLVVDDDPAVLETVVAILRAKGYQTIQYEDPAVLLREFDDLVRCDVLVTDVLMPTVSGPQLAASLLESRPSLPVVFISGYVHDLVDEVLPGPLVAKPFRARELLNAVADVLAHSTGVGHDL